MPGPFTGGVKQGAHPWELSEEGPLPQKKGGGKILKLASSLQGATRWALWGGGGAHLPGGADAGGFHGGCSTRGPSPGKCSKKAPSHGERGGWARKWAISKLASSLGVGDFETAKVPKCHQKFGKGGPLCMVKWSCTVHPHTKNVPRSIF